jgi:hypothetical protein
MHGAAAHRGILAQVRLSSPGTDLDRMRTEEKDQTRESLAPHRAFVRFGGLPTLVGQRTDKSRLRDAGRVRDEKQRVPSEPINIFLRRSLNEFPGPEFERLLTPPNKRNWPSRSHDNSSFLISLFSSGVIVCLLSEQLCIFSTF